MSIERGNQAMARDQDRPPGGLVHWPELRWIPGHGFGCEEVLSIGKRSLRSASGEAVQNALLKIVDGAPMQVKNHQYIDTLPEPKNLVYKQFRQIFADASVELAIEKQVLEQIADLAIEYKIGARSLRGIFEEMITPVLYVVPDSPDIQRVVVTSLFEEAALVRGKQGRPAVGTEAS
jgi:ATP-dependent protease Clp ATPase subunit